MLDSQSASAANIWHARRMCASFVLTMSVVLLASSCNTSSRDQSKAGLHRSDLTKWEVRELPLAKATIDLPCDVFHVGDGIDDVWITLHPFYPYPYGIDEARPMVSIMLKKTTVEKLQQKLAGLLKYTTDRAERAIWEWHDCVHIETARQDTDTYAYYRRDYLLDSNNLWSATVEFLSPRRNGERLYLDEDDKAIRRILDSFKPLEKDEK